MNKDSVKSFFFIVGRALSDLVVWLFASFLLPLIQLGILLFRKDHDFEINAAVFNILFVTIASFLTNVFFFTGFWEKRNNWLRMALIVSYVLALTLFIISLIEIIQGITIFELDVYRYGMLISLALAIIVGFTSKYDENKVKALDIARRGKDVKGTTVEGKEVEL